MKKGFQVMRREDGAELIEAAIIYPFVLLILSSLLYIGVFILQYVTVGAYAQKVALLAAREVAYPGYISLISADHLKTSAIEVALNDYSQAPSSDTNNPNGTLISFPTAAYAAHARAYRYWKSNPLEPNSIEAHATKASDQYNSGALLEDILREMVDQNSIMLGKQNAEVHVYCKNVIVAQYVTVTVDQDLINNQLLTALGMEQPAIHVAAVASANDTDEFVRNTDFVCDALEMIAKKLHINVNDIREKVNGLKETLHLD